MARTAPLAAPAATNWRRDKNKPFRLAGIGINLTLEFRPVAAQRHYKSNQSLQDGTRTMLVAEASAGLCRKSLKLHAIRTKNRAATPASGRTARLLLL
jgi:hypothetical protein